MITLKTILRRARTLFWTAFSILVILAAFIVGLGQLLLPYSDRYQPRLESWLSEEFGRPVELESFTGEWTAFGPRLSLQGMTLLPAGAAEVGMGEVAAEVAIESAALDIKPLNALVPGRPLYNFRVIGADLELRHTVDGRFELSGFGVSRRGAEGQGSALGELARVGEVILQDSSLVYQDEKYGVLLGFSGIDGSLRMDGEQLATEVRASFRDARSGMVYGEVEATLLMTFGADRKMTGFSWQATAQELMLAAFQGRLPKNPFLPLTGWLNAEMWGEWSADAGHLVKGVTDLRDARLVNDYQDLRLDRVNYRFRWRFTNKGDWELHLADLLFDDGEKSWTAPRISMARSVAEGLGLWISADELPLDVPLNLARDVMSVYRTAWPDFLPRSAAGKVEGLDLILDDRWRLKLARGAVSGASVLDWDRWPDVQGLDGTIALREGFGRLDFSGREVVLDWPRMFRAPLAFTLPGCQVDIRWGQDWQVGFNHCTLENEDLAARAKVIISGDEGKPDVDVNAAITRGDIAALDAYWPEAILKPNIKSWLRQGLQSGRIVRGRFQIHGDMDDWPFRHGRGRFEALAEIQGGRIDYYPGWPAAGGVNATARFVGAAMEIDGTVGAIGGVTVDEVDVEIPDMKSPVLSVRYGADAELPEFLGFLQQTPLNDQINVDLSDFRFAGAARTDGRLTVPLGASRGDLEVDGVVRLGDASFLDPETDIELNDIKGDLHYDQAGFSGSGLEARFREYAAELDLAAGVERPERFRADLTGVFGVRDVIPAFLLESYAELARVDGDCLWDVSLVVAPGDDPDVNETVLTVGSALIGVELGLPAPLDKPAGESWPLQLRFPLAGAERILDVEFEDQATLRFDLPPEAESPRRSVIRLGGGQPALPPEGFIRIEGESERVDLDGWIDVIVEGAAEGRGMGGLELETGSIAARKLLFLDRYFEDVWLDFNVVESDIRAEFAAEAINGKVRFTSGETGMNSLSAEFERLDLGEPVSKGVDMESNPADLPALHLYAKSFRYAGVELGETRIEAYPTAKGFHFEKVDASSERLSVQARGDWSLDERGQRSDFTIHMASESLGDFLQSMEISSSMQGGQTLVEFDAWWPGSPAGFALARLNGEIVFSVVDGNITNASSGAGRLLGLLSIQALPRRLSLDFRDVFDSGFSFEEATGTFQMQNGTARTEDLVLKSSAASIFVEGNTNLVEKRYDQLMTIRPGLGNTLPIIGALAAGPGGAVAGLALQGMLGDELAEATQVQYSITGDWSEPVIEAVDVKRVEPQVPAEGEDNEQDP